MQSGDPRPVLAGDVALLAPRAVIGDIEGIAAGPDAPRMYATCDTVAAHQAAGTPERLIGAAGTLIVNAGEAALITGQSDPEEARGDRWRGSWRRRSSRSAPTARWPRAAASWRTPRRRDSRRGR